MSRTIMTKGQELQKGDSLVSKNGNWKLVFQHDGNLVLYGWDPKWASDTYGSGATRLCMQRDCNLVMYKSDNKPCWHTNTHTGDNCNCSLTLTNEGKLVLKKDDNMLWNSTQNHGMK